METLKIKKIKNKKKPLFFLQTTDIFVKSSLQLNLAMLMDQKLYQLYKDFYRRLSKKRHKVIFLFFLGRFPSLLGFTLERGTTSPRCPLNTTEPPEIA